MKNWKESLYRKALGIYFKFEKTPVLAGVNLLAYRLFEQLKNPQSRGGAICKEPYQKAEQPLELSKVRIALIADQMTYDNLNNICRCTALNCAEWSKQIVECRPHFFLCESAWLGNEADGHCWRGQIYKNKEVWFENRKTVLKILDYCRENGIPTVFYNKEDPTSFDDPYHNFVDLALKFDHIYTTAEECVEKYKALGAKHCDCLPLGVSLRLFNPYTEGRNKREGAVFAGSWYAEFPERCKDMEALFDMVLENGIPLTIYDRNYGDPNPQKQFPEKYRPFVKPAVSYSVLGQRLKKYEYALNINTVKDSETMFARRVYEVMAAGLYVISNESVGMRKQFGDRVTYIGETIPDKEKRKEFILKNMEYVFEHHSFENMLTKICTDLDLSEAYLGRRIVRVDREVLSKKDGFIPKLDTQQYTCIGYASMDVLQKAVMHFSYLPYDVGIYLYGGDPSFYPTECPMLIDGVFFCGTRPPAKVICLGYKKEE